MPFTLVIDEQTAWGDEARVSKTSVCGSWGGIAGELRYFADKFGNPRASIEGTQIPHDLLRRFADVAAGEVVYDANNRRSPLAIRRRVTYHGFELERDVEVIDEFPPDLADRARHAIAEALARGEARHHGARENQDAVELIRETYRRSGGQTPRLSFADLTALYERQLANVNSLTQFKQAPITIDADAIVPPAIRERYASLPSSARVRDRDIEIHYDVEENADGTPLGVARLRLPEKLARTLTEEELPALDRPLRFIVTRGARGAARASTLSVLQDELERPFTEQELVDLERSENARRQERRDRKRDRRVQESGERLKDHRRVGDSRQDGRRGSGGGRSERFRPAESRGSKRKRRPRG
jgi:ATP-dependent RNA helicase HrpA